MYFVYLCKYRPCDSIFFNKGGVFLGKAATKAKNKYNAENYERISLSVPKGKKEAWKNAAAVRGFSLNQFIIDTVEREIEEAGA